MQCLASKFFSFIFLNSDPGMVPQNIIGVCRLLLPRLAGDLAADSKPNMNLKYSINMCKLWQQQKDLRHPVRVRYSEFHA